MTGLEGVSIDWSWLAKPALLMIFILVSFVLLVAAEVRAEREQAERESQSGK